MTKSQMIKDLKTSSVSSWISASLSSLEDEEEELSSITSRP